MNAPQAAVEVNPHAVMCPNGAWAVLVAVTVDRSTGIVRYHGCTLLGGFPLGALTFYVPKTPQRDRAEVNDRRPYPVKRRNGG